VFSQVNCVCIAGILALRFLFSILWCSHTGYHSQEELARFGYRSERKVEKFKNTAIFSWPAGIYSLNKVISEKNSSETGDFGAFISQNSFVWVVLNFFCLHFSEFRLFQKCNMRLQICCFFFDRPNRVSIHIHSNLINFSYLSFTGHPASMKVMH
jgi:hypothetical protein